MIRNYLKIIWRNLYRQPVHTLLNLSCLTVGIAATLFILLYIDFELHFDRSNDKADHIYRIETKSIQTPENVREVGFINTPGNLGPLIQQDYPEVEHFVRSFQFFRDEMVTFQYSGDLFEEAAVYAVDPAIFEVFTLKMIKGDPSTALTGPNKILLSESFAQRIFGDENPLGKTLETNLVHSYPDTPEEQYSFQITGVYQDMPRNSHRLANALISAESDPRLTDYYFNRFNVSTYVLLHDQVDPVIFAPKLSEIYDKYLDRQREQVLVSATHTLNPLTKIHLAETGGYTYIFIFSAIGVLLLLISVISYVNLVTAQASRRALEIGLRKVLGSNRKQLMAQFLVESIGFSFLALLLGILLVFLMMQPLNAMLGLQLYEAQLWQPQMIIGSLVITLLLGLLGGSYPAFFLSSFQPIAVMKGQLAKATPLRRMLVAVQFAVVIFVLTFTGMIYDQLQYLSKKDLGFDKKNIVELNLAGQEKLEKWPVLKEMLLQSPYISSAGTSSFTPGDNMGRRPISANGTAGQEPQFVRWGVIDYDFLETMDIKFVEGRNFSWDFPGDLEQSVVINQRFAKEFGLTNPVGEKIRLGGSGNPNFLIVIGVVEDFHQSSLHSPIESQLFFVGPASLNLSIKVQKDLSAGLDAISESWAVVFPDTPFEYHFLEDELQRSYEADQRRGKIFFSFSLLTIFIAFVGLFGLASYLSKQRTKEIGIRKVLGASIGEMVILLSKDFLWLVVLAAIPAFATAWYMIGQWLENFATQTSMNYLLYALVLLATLLLTFIVTGFHAFRAALVNPVESLKYE
ncbi:MAG: ABC transporter permease [Saprospiraceae bacterium]|nr:MAG: ABC transporter permease [Saprospiraceae bacterium]